MFITLSEERNEKILVEWSGEITDKHAQDFCDVCNTALQGFYDLDYIHRKYDENIYGKSFITTIYKDGKPVATRGAWRSDINGRVAFQVSDLCTLQEVRKGSYMLELDYVADEEIAKVDPSAIVFVFPNQRAYSIYDAMGYTVTPFFKRIYHGNTKDFQDSMPMIDDDYCEAFLLKRRNIKFYVKEIDGEAYLAEVVKLKYVIPGLHLWGKISGKIASKLSPCKKTGLMVYYSQNKGLIGVAMYTPHSVIKDLSKPGEKVSFIPPLYRTDTFSLDYNGINHH